MPVSEDMFKNVFIKTCEKYIKEFGITEYYVSFHCKSLDNVGGTCNVDYTSRMASITLNLDLDIDAEQCMEIALHEVLELLLVEFEIICRNVSSKDVRDAVRHTVINRLQKYFELKEELWTYPQKRATTAQSVGASRFFSMRSMMPRAFTPRARIYF